MNTTKKNAGNGIEAKKVISSAELYIVIMVLNTSANIDIPQVTQIGNVIVFKISLIGCIDNPHDLRQNTQIIPSKRILLN